MEMVSSEFVDPIPADTWTGMAGFTTGPGTFVFVVSCPLSDTETMQVQVIEDPEGTSTAVVMEDYTVGATERSDVFAWAGFQSSPIPLVASSWTVKLRAKHDSATDKGFAVRVIKL